METVITKSYQGAQTRLLLPKVKDVAGVIGDNNSTRLIFKLPKAYNTGWIKYIEFDCEVDRDGTLITPSYLLDENNSATIPLEVTEALTGKEVRYNLKLVSNDGTVVEKSEMSTLYFRDSSNGTNTQPAPYEDIITLLYNNAFCNVAFSVDATAPSGVTVPQLTFTPLNTEGEPESVILNMPYLDANGYIPPSFIDKEIVVEIFRITTPEDLTDPTKTGSAQVPDMALLSEWRPSAEGEEAPPYYMNLYMLIGNDPTNIDNWYLLHTDNPTFISVHATSADFDETTTVGLTVTGDESVSGNLSVTGQTSTAQVNTPKINGTGTSPNAPLEITGNTTVKDSLTVQGSLASQSFTDNGAQVTFTKNIVASNTNISAKNVNVGTKTTTGTLESGAAKFTGNIDATGNTITATTFSGTATTAQNYDANTGTIKQHVETHGADQTYGHVKFKEEITANTDDTTISEIGIKNFVNSSINAVAAYYITYNAQGDRFPSAQALRSATTLYSGGEVRVPTRNDYAVVIADETHPDYTIYSLYASFTTTAQYIGHYVDFNNAKTLVTQQNKDSLSITPGTTVAYERIISDARYIYAGTGDTYDGTKWEYNFPLGRTFTNAEVLAMDSGITAEKVEKLDGIAAGAQVNVLESVKINGSALTVSDKAVDIGVSPSNPILEFGQEATIGTIAGQTFKVTMPVNPDTDEMVRQRLVSGNAKRPILFSYATTSDSTENVTGIAYRNNSIYINPSTGSVYAPHVYSNDSEVVNLADVQTISGEKSYSGHINVLDDTFGFRAKNSNLPQSRSSFYSGSGTLNYDMCSYVNSENTKFAQINVQDNAAYRTLHLRLYSPTLNTWSGLMIQDDGSAVYTTTPTRTYNASNTNDVVTIGSLQASTDVVHRTGDEGIGGAKTFGNTPIINSHNIILKNTTYAKSLVTSTYTNLAEINLLDKNDAILAQIRNDHMQGDVRRTYILTERTINGTVYQNRVSMCIETSGSAYVTVPYRSTPTGDFEVLTRGNGVTLATEQTISGEKTFSTIPTVKRDNAGLSLYTTKFAIADVVSVNYNPHIIQFMDKNGAYCGGLVNRYYATNNDHRVNLEAFGKDNVLRQLNLYAGDGYAYATAPNRTYNASNTSDIVTIGSLQSSTDVVHRTGDEEISGNKTFTQSFFHIKSTNIANDEPPQSDVIGSRLQFVPNNTTAGNYTPYLGQIVPFHYRTYSELVMYTSRVVSGTRYSATLGPRVTNDGVAYARASYRTYNQSNTDDVVTIGMLNTNMTIGGIKTFSENIFSKGDARLLVNGYTLGTAPSSDTWSNGYRICDKDGQWVSAFQTWIGSNGYNQARLITRDSSTGTAGQFSVLSTYMTGPNRSYASAGLSDVLVKAHVADMMSANVSNQQISLTSSRGVAVDSFTLNQMSSKNIVLPAGSTQYQNQEVTFSAQSPADFSDYPYMASLSITGLTADMYATVTFSESQVSSGQYAPFCQTVNGAVRLYAKSGVGTQTIPTISVGMDDSSAQQSMSNFVTLTGAQSITGNKTFTTHTTIDGGRLDIKNGTTRAIRIIPSGLPSRSQNPSSRIDMDYLRVEDSQGLAVAVLNNIVDTNGTRNLLFGLHNGSSFNWLKVCSDSLGGTGYVLAPYRDYSSSTINDVVTIGSLQASTDVVHTSGNETRSGILSTQYYGQNITNPIDSAKWVKWIEVRTSPSFIEAFGTRNNNDLFYAMFMVAGYWGYDRTQVVVSSGPNNANIRMVVCYNTTTGYHEIWVNGGGNTTYLSSIYAGVKFGGNPVVINEEYDSLPSEGYSHFIYVVGRA